MHEYYFIEFIQLAMLNNLFVKQVETLLQLTESN